MSYDGDYLRLLLELNESRHALLAYARRLYLDYGIDVHVVRHPRSLPTERGDWAWTILMPTKTTRRYPPADVVMGWKALVSQALRLRRAAEELRMPRYLAFPLSLFGFDER